MWLRVKRHQILLSILFLALISGTTVISIYAEEEYTRSFAVTITTEKSFLGIFTWTENQEKTVTATVSDESYRYWRSERQHRWARWHTSWWDYSYDYSWLVKTGAEHSTMKNIVTQLKAFNLNDEDYVNAVLQIVYQFTYDAGQPPKLAIETIVDGTADCDGFSVFVATLLRASGYQIVLIWYRAEEHMVAGVHLDARPKNTEGGDVYYFEYKGARYYICEATGQTGERPWRVGELSEDYRGHSAYIIPV